MRIVACVRPVPDVFARQRIDPSTGRIDRSGSTELSDADLQAVEEALRVREEADGDGEVVLASVAPDGVLVPLRKALAMGADRAVAVSDEAVADSDALASSRVLAALVRRTGAQLAVFGQAAADSDGGLLAGAVAERLGWPFLSQVGRVSVQDDTLWARRQSERGYEEFTLRLPAVIAVSDAINTPRHPALAATLKARSKPQESLTAGDLGLDPTTVGVAGSATVILGAAPAPARPAPLRIEGDEQTAERLYALLAEQDVL